MDDLAFYALAACCFGWHVRHEVAAHRRKKKMAPATDASKPRGT